MEVSVIHCRLVDLSVWGLHFKSFPKFLQSRVNRPNITTGINALGSQFNGSEISLSRWGKLAGP